MKLFVSMAAASIVTLGLAASAQTAFAASHFSPALSGPSTTGLPIHEAGVGFDGSGWGTMGGNGCGFGNGGGYGYNGCFDHQDGYYGFQGYSKRYYRRRGSSRRGSGYRRGRGSRGRYRYGR